MTRAYRNIILSLLLIIYVLIVGQYWQDNSVIQNTIAVACSMIAALLMFALDFVLLNMRRFKLFYQTRWKYRKKHIRFSMSYIYRIRVQDKYLLVKNSKWDFYQPVGGVYKRLPETQKLINDLQIKDDPKMETFGTKKGDLRVFVPSKNAIKFLDWFDSKEEREVSQWREFHEELIKTGILTHENFPYINCRYVGTVRTPIKRASKWDCMEMLNYEVYDLIPTDEQEKELIELQKENSDLYIWADEHIIRSLGYDQRTHTQPYEIGKHTRWTLDMKYEKE